jgi:hypothetical protein
MRAEAWLRGGKSEAGQGRQVDFTPMSRPAQSQAWAMSPVETQEPIMFSVHNELLHDPLARGLLPAALITAGVGSASLGRSSLRSTCGRYTIGP